MEEQRKKFGIELRPSLHKALKQWALDHDVYLHEATEAAVNALLGKQQDARYNPQHAKAHQLLETILSSGTKQQADWITGNHVTFVDAIKPAAPRVEEEEIIYRPKPAKRKAS